MVHPIDIHVGQRLKQQRVRLGLSQGALGKTVGVTFQQIQKYETGSNRVSASRLHELANVLAVGVGFFYEGSGSELASGMAEAPAPYGDSGVAIEDEVKQLTSAYRSIPDAKTRNHLLKFVKALAISS